MSDVAHMNILKAVMEPGGEEKLLIDGTEVYPWFHIDSYGFFLDTFTRGLAKVTQWRELRTKGASWEEIARRHRTGE